ncbi:MAG: type II secretion system protein [Candidatus Jorgensenbacteria bacterium]|nr:type II secretion system protein [Candidatus Jorgensenbacteria bacterium]
MEINKTNSRRIGGFTLVELIIAAGLFAFAISIIVGVFGQALSSQKLLNSLIQRNSNAGLMIEQMMREIRVGYEFSPAGGVCSNDLTFNRFPATTGSVDQVRYRLEGNSIKRSVNNASPSTLNSSNIRIESICFKVNQTNAELPWRVTILMKIGSTDPRLAGKSMNIETTVSPRTLPRDIH